MYHQAMNLIKDIIKLITRHDDSELRHKLAVLKEVVDSYEKENATLKDRSTALLGEVNVLKKLIKDMEMKDEKDFSN